MAFPNIIRKLVDLIGRVGAAETAITKKAPTSHAATATTYGKGTESLYGHVKLSDATNGTSGESGGIAATPAAVKAAYSLASTANSTAGTASSTANTANTTANNAMPKSGGTFTGNVVYKQSAEVILDISATATTLGTAVRYPLQVKYKNTNGNVYSSTPFSLIPSDDTANNGSGLVFQPGGVLVLASGESGKTTVSGATINGKGENLYLTSDYDILFLTNLQSKYADAKTMTFNKAGNLVLPTGSTISGASAFKGKADTAGTADKLATARSLKVALNKTGTATFNGAADQNDIPVQGVLAIANGGTGNANGKAVSATTATYLAVTTYSDDLNNLTTPGLYYVTDGTTDKHFPVGTNGQVIVITKGNFTRQIFLRAGTVNSNEHQNYSREKQISSNTWGDWYWFVNSKHLPLSVERGGTGNTTGTAAKATSATATPNIKIKSMSSSTALTLPSGGTWTAMWFSSGNNMDDVQIYTGKAGGASCSAGSKYGAAYWLYWRTA